jgi:hypothetical protein
MPLWVAFDLLVLRPEAINQPETTMTRRWWLGAPMVAVAILFGGRWIAASQQAQARQLQFKVTPHHRPRRRRRPLVQKRRIEFSCNNQLRGMAFKWAIPSRLLLFSSLKRRLFDLNRRNPDRVDLELRYE